MFGAADICGALNKVHFVKQNSSHSEEYIEVEHHHLKLPPTIQSDKRTQVFSAILKPDNALRVLIQSGQWGKDSQLPLVPSKTFPCKAQDLDGIEIWTMRYANILMASDEKAEAEKIEFDLLKIADVPSLTKYKHQILDHFHKAQNQPDPRIGDYILALIFIALIITILFSWKKNAKLAAYDNLQLVPFSGGGVIETVVTKRAEEVDAWISSIRSTCNAKPKPIVVGLDCEWKPNTVKLSTPNKAAILQLCVDTKCIVIQLLYMDVPESVHSFLADPDFIFVGVEVKRDIKKLSNEYGIGCTRFEDLRNLALRSEVYAFCYKYGLRNLASNVVGLEIAKPAHACRSNWEARDLDEQQIQYASIDAYASFRIGHKLITEMPDCGQVQL